MLILPPDMFISAETAVLPFFPERPAAIPLKSSNFVFELFLVFILILPFLTVTPLLH